MIAACLLLLSQRRLLHSASPNWYSSDHSIILLAYVKTTRALEYWCKYGNLHKRMICPPLSQTSCHEPWSGCWDTCNTLSSTCHPSVSSIHTGAMAYEPYNVPKLLADIQSNGSQLTAKGDNENARLEALTAARTLCHALETPREAIVNRCYAQVCSCTSNPFTIKLAHCVTRL